MHSQMDMLRPVLGSLNKVTKEAVPCFVNGILEMGILLLIDHFYKKTSLAAPEKKLDYHTWSKLAHIPTIALKGGLDEP